MNESSIELLVSPSLDQHGRKSYCNRGQLFDGYVGDRPVVERSTQPFCDAARVLLSEGVNPAAWLVMRHAGSATEALRSTVGVAAKLSVSDDRLGKPIFTRWKPRPDGLESSSGDAPMRPIEEPVLG